MPRPIGPIGSFGGHLELLGSGPAPPTGLDVFEHDPGVDASRIIPRGIVPADGSYVFCLGHDEPGYTGFVQPGDFVDIAQTGTFPAGNVFTFQAVTRGPVIPLPPGYAWIASVLMDGTTIGSRTLAPLKFPDDDADSDDVLEPTSWEWYVDLTGITGSHKISFRLTFTGPSLPTPPPEVRLPVLEVEIPAFYVDDLVFSTIAGSGAPFISNEVPTAGQGEGVAGPAPLDTTAIDFDLFGLGSHINLGSIAVTINGTPAIVGGAIQSGFHGSIGASAEITHVTIAPNISFASNSIVTVSVSAANLSPHTNTRTWTFQVADTTAPVMSSIQALATRQLRITWSKVVDADDPVGPHDALNPALYYVQAVQPENLTPVVTGGPVGPLIYSPAPYITVVSVAVVPSESSSVVDIFTSDELTPGITYLVTEVGVADLAGNFETSVTATTSFVPPVPVGRALNLYRLMPLMNRQEDVTQDLLRFLNCLQEPTGLLLHDVDTWTNIFNFNLADDAFLSAILADLGNPFPFVLSTESKRQLIAILVAIYKQKGTAIGIINAVRFFLGLTITIGTYDSSGEWILGESILGEDPISFPAGNNASITRIGLTTQYSVTGLTGIDPSFTETTIKFEGAANLNFDTTVAIATVTGPTSLTFFLAGGYASDTNNGFISWQVTDDASIFTGSAVLGPGGSYALYAFTIISSIALTAAQEEQIEFIANYMKPAHTHLIGIVVPTSPPTYDPVELGISELGEDWILHA
jgi:phage tail-like protein